MKCIAAPHNKLCVDKNLHTIFSANIYYVLAYHRVNRLTKQQNPNDTQKILRMGRIKWGI